MISLNIKHQATFLVSKLTIIGSDNGCGLLGAKPLSKPTLGQLDPKENWTLRNEIQ